MSKHHRSILNLIQTYADEPTCGVEVGVYLGETAVMVHKAFPRCHLTLIDPWRPYSKTDRTLPNESKASHSMEFHKAGQWQDILEKARNTIASTGGPSTVLRMSSEEAALCVNGRFDFVFLDGLHSYDRTKEDINLWLPKTRRLLMGHDYNGKMDKQGIRGVKRAVDEVFGNRVIVSKWLVWAVVL